MHSSTLNAQVIGRDLVSGLVVFLVALPLCLGVALASGADLFSGILAGIIGGVIVGTISGSQTSVAGPAAGLTAVVAAEVAALGKWEYFLVAVFLAGVIQLALGFGKAGFLAEYFPTSVIKGLLAAIGIILILKQIPHLFGHDADYEGDFSFFQPDKENTFTELFVMLFDLQPGSMVVGLGSLLLLISWHRFTWLNKAGIPAALAVVVIGVIATIVLRSTGGNFAIAQSHLVTVPVSGSFSEFRSFLSFPDFTGLTQSRVYLSAITIAVVASLETLLNIEAVDRIDPKQRITPPNRELVAQGVGNMTAGLVGALPVTSVIVRSSVNIQTGNVTKLSTIFHGLLLFLCVLFIPKILNLIPLSSLAAILIVTGYKLAKPELFRSMWKRGCNQFLPFVATVVAIVLSDLLIGILIGLAIAAAFILRNNLRFPVKATRERHVGGEVTRIELGNQVTFLNKAALGAALNTMQRGQHVLIDARATEYLDPDVEDMILDFDKVSGPARGINVSLVGFREKEAIQDQIRYIDTSTPELQKQLSPQDVIDILREGNERFRSGQRISRDFTRQTVATASGQYPLAVVLSCIDSRTPAEIVFDLGLGDIFSIRIAGNVAKEKVLGSMEYGCRVAGAKLIVVMGHTRCGAVRSSVDLFMAEKPSSSTGCEHLESLVGEIQKSLKQDDRSVSTKSAEEIQAFADHVAELNVTRTVDYILEESHTLREMVEANQVVICGAMYDVSTGAVNFNSMSNSQGDGVSLRSIK